MKNKLLNIMIVVIIITTIVITGCKKDTTPTQPKQQCYDPYIVDGNDCCLDKNKNNVCDEDEGVPEEERQLHDKDIGRVIGTIADKYGKIYDLYPDDKYDYSSSDRIFEDYNRSIKLPGKQCHFYSDRVHIVLKETHPWWRPLPIPCNTDEDCVTFVKKNDNYLRLLLYDEEDIMCMTYQEYK